MTNTLFRYDIDKSPSAPVLVHALAGAIDAGQAGQQVAQHLGAALQPQRVATFDIDQLIDYRGRRPVMTFDGTWIDYAAPMLVVDQLRDDDGVPFLLLHGAEPDLRWEAVADAVGQIVADCDVELIVGMHGIPMGVPHTRPIAVTAHSSNPALVEPAVNIFGRVQVPASAAAVIEYRLADRGVDVIGMAAHVPHYLMQRPYPPAAAELVRRLSRASGLALPLGDLEARGVQVRAEIDRLVGESEELQRLVAALQVQADSFAAELNIAPAPVAEVPTAEELGAEVEAFLAGRRPEPEGPPSVTDQAPF